MNKITKKTNLTVLFDNDQLIACDKPSGMPAAPDQHTELSTTLMGLAQDHCGTKLFIVHRLDKGSSGVVIFAKNANAKDMLAEQFAKGLIRSSFIALLNGTLENDSGIIDAPMSVNGEDAALDRNGNASVTKYEVLERFRDFTIVEAFPGTGRRHQLRLHFISIGHPLAIDGEYSGRAALLLSEFKKRYKPTRVEKPLLSRVSLHAKSLTFTVPGAGGTVTIESPLPHDLEVAFKQLRKYNR